MKSMTASLVGGSLYCPLGLFLSLHTLASIVFGAIPRRSTNEKQQEKLYASCK